MGLSRMQVLAAQPPQQQRDFMAALNPAEHASLAYDWQFWARPEQLPPEGDWRVWLVQAGRGFGKTRLGAEWVREMARKHPQARIALIAPTASDARDVMVEGESGIMAISSPVDRPIYEPSKRRLTWPNGAQATTYSADEPERLRGPQHSHLWADEPASWRYPDAWAMAMFGLRLGTDPRSVVTGTPKPVPLIRELRALPTTIITRGRTLDNAANLAPQFIESITAKYGGTRLGRQELDGELLEDTPGSLWQYAMLSGEGFRLTEAPPMSRIVVGVDPAVTSGEGSDETGIIVAGLGTDDRYYVLADRTIQGSPLEWATATMQALTAYRADRIIVERNNGGEMIEATLRQVNRDAPITTVWASRGKLTRAEPIAALYEQRRVSHVGPLDQLETQLLQWVPGEGQSPDRLDALVWALHELSQGNDDLGLYVG